MNKVLAIVALLTSGVDAFSTVSIPHSTSRIATSSNFVEQSSLTALYMSDRDSDFMKWAKASRSASADDNVVELMKPLGLILNEDERGNVFVETVAPKGNAARSGKVKEGDYVTMCSATFGDEMWSVRGVGLGRVMAAIRVRQGNKVKLVFESPTQSKAKKAATIQQLQASQEAAATAQAKKDALLRELQDDEKRLNPKKFFGLF